MQQESSGKMPAQLSVFEQEDFLVNFFSFHSEVTAQDICGNFRFRKMVKAEHRWQNRG
jgi:hypothetical protein